MKITKKHTKIVLMLFIGGLLGWEVLTIAFGEDATISECIWMFLKSNPFRYVAVLSFGVLLGHFFWQNKKGSK